MPIQISSCAPVNSLVCHTYLKIRPISNAATKV